jgi:hypothetical protein
MAAPAFGQAASTATISGTVVDSGGGVIPGATVVVTNEAGAKLETVTNSQGVFNIPAVTAGAYKVSVSLSGFKTWTTDVRVAVGTPVNLKAILEVGAITEEVIVRTSSEILNTQTATVASTLNADQINRMPTPTRNALNAVTFLPGVNTASTNRNSTVNGLPESMINITLDGVGNNDNFNKSTDGFFASVTPRQDAIEAVTVTTAVSGANQGGSGGVTIAMQTRSGTNQFSGSGYEYFRHPNMNTNSWGNQRNNLPKNDIKLNQFGARTGGPIVLPGLYDGRGKAFYFFHYEQLRLPRTDTRTREVWQPEVLDGWVSYSAGDDVRRINVLDVARATGNLTTPDPLSMKLLNLIRNSTLTTGVINQTDDLLTDDYVWQVPGRLFEQQPTARVDINLTPQHRLSGSFSSIFTFRDRDYLNGAEENFPGAPNYRVFKSTRPLYSFTLRSTLSSNAVNELRSGLTAVGGAGSRFGQPDDPSTGRDSFADLDHLAVVLPTVDDWWVINNPSWRAAPTYNIDETLSWQAGRHSFNFGASFLRSSAWEMAQQIVPTVTLGFVSAEDPANGMFNSTNFPGASSGELNDARDIYGMLTGRVEAIGGQAALDPNTNKYVAFGPRRREGRVDVYSAFAQDSWRMTPTLTLNYGVRWDVQLPFTTVNDTMSTVTLQSACGMSGLGDGGTYSKCAFFSRKDVSTQPGYVPPQFIQYSGGTKGYDTDWNNFAPSLGIAWRPNVQSGILRAMLGDPEAATIRGGYSVSYERQGIGRFTGQFGANPGSTITISRTNNIGNLVNTAAGETWPLLLSQRERITPAPFNDTPSFPIAVRAGRADDLQLFAPDIRVASARSWTVGLQRSLSRDMAVELRYVGTRGVDQWSELNYNEPDIINNGFYEEFKLAVANLQANNAAGGSRAGSFAYFGPSSGTSPLPTYLAYLNGRTNAGDPAAYSGSNWRSTALTGDMAVHNQFPRNSAADLDSTSSFRNNALSAGIPANFFVVNPDVDDVQVFDSGAYSDYHALQAELRRRLSRGLQANVSYQYAVEGGSGFLGFGFGRVMQSSPNVRHAIKTQWDWTLPVGRGQRFGTDMHPILDTLLGGWSFNGVGRVQAVMVNFGNVRLVGMTAKDLQKMYRHDIVFNDDGVPFVQMLPDDVILNTRRAFSTSATSATGYGSLGVPEGRYIAPANSAMCTEIKLGGGDCAPRTLLIRAPWFSRFDVGVAKRIALKGRTNLEVRFEMLNLFDNVNFNNGGLGNNPSSATIFQVTSHYTDANNTFDPGGRLGQFMIRINW